MAERSEITKRLSDLVAKRLVSQDEYWSSEVTFDQWRDSERRIDFVGFKPGRSGMAVTAATIELGEFSCYEVKSCMGDFKSGHGLSFYGDHNYLVTTQEFAEELYQKIMLPNNIDAVLCPDKNWTRLYRKFDFGPNRNRARPASEMLWNIVLVHGHRNG
ncbi:hypothetical protein [Loigolactobacillus bifermentans]|uniref:Uncharacterized protein n=1 Tax=Loigolactobacillus bifermentans DSM 20003 TaxID=1423726 RepID=A0A0R1H372_9LACO|nr:hypothetical protein [Loigolactobacillus bifermentans]KRK38995.1 hypothetical protein FC07_GL002711 [Loigolactobacillus bifermentans DSM 20003]QGG59120.1 hypothetical protein LB003_00835 [Loigolactobacillus bifermentans]